MQFLTYLKLVISLLPTIIDFVKSLEKAIPDGNKGDDKLKALQAILETVYKNSSDATVKFEKLWPVINSVIGTVVSLFNKTGVFKKQ